MACPKCGKENVPINPQTGLCIDCIKVKESESKTVGLKVTVDSQQMEDLIDQKKELEAERDDYKEKLNLIAEQDLERKMRELHVPEDQKNHFRENPTELLGYAQAKREMQKSEIPHGNAPLPKNYYNPDGSFRPDGSANSNEGFSSHEEMIDDLRIRSHKGDAQATKILEILTEKALKGQIKQETGIKSFEPEKDAETEIQRLKRVFREKKQKGE